MAYSKTCKYCNLVKIEWDDKEGKYFEVDSKQQHTKERCQEAQNKGGTFARPVSDSQRLVDFKHQGDQKTADIKAAQLERRNQHRELIKNLQWNTKVLAYLAQVNGGDKLEDTLSDIGFESYREDQQSFQDEVV